MESPPKNNKPPCVLVIDDEDYVADMISAALEMEGYTAYKAYDGRQGLSLVKRYPVDMVITDIMMPHIDGNHLVRMLSDMERTRQIPILIISAGAYPTDMPANVSFLAKPFDIQTILEFVKGVDFTS